jgi:L-ascorbate metabolism protein UlaG (beta-lactamase superfamily)
MLLVLLCAACGATANDTGRLSWLGGPTAILERRGIRLMTDPMLGPHEPRAFTLPIHPSTGERDAPVARYTDPPSRPLPPLDVVILSHGHNDHFDRRARELLPKDTLMVAPPHVEPLLREAGFTRVRTLDWGQSMEVTGAGGARLTITAVEGDHAHDAALAAQLGKVNGYVLAWGDYTVYWTGDSVIYDGQAETVARHGPIDLLLPHLGGVGGDGARGLRTMDADEAVTLIARVRPRQVIPIHHTTFGHYREPVSALEQRFAAAKLPGVLTVVPEGGSVGLRPR